MGGTGDSNGGKQPDHEGGDTWREQDGYGERVLDPDAVSSPAEEERDRSDETDPHGGSR